MNISEFANDCLINQIQYKRDGRNHNGLDCYGFVYNYYKSCENIILPDDVFYKIDIDPFVKAIKDPIEDGCIVHLRSTFGSMYDHIGLYYKGYIYHYTDGGLQIKRVDRYKNLIRGFYCVIKN